MAQGNDITTKQIADNDTIYWNTGMKSQKQYKGPSNLLFCYYD